MKSVMLVAALLVTAPVAAHHGFTAFDTKTVVTYQGTVTDFHFVNPHSVVEFDVKDGEGRVQAWKVELSSAGHLAARGLTAASLEAGDTVTISGYRARNGANSVWATSITLPGGKKLDFVGDR